MISRVFLAIFLWCAATLAHAQSYNWPADLTGPDFNCTLTGPGDYTCPAMSFSKDMYIVITSPITVHVNGNFSAAKNFIIPKGAALLLDVKGNVNFAMGMNGYFDIKSSGSMTFAKNTILYGDLNSGGNVTIAKDSLIDGDVFAKNTLKVGKNSSITGNCSYANSNYQCNKVTPPPVGSVDHFLVDHDGTGITCAPTEVTVWACSGASAGGTCPTTTAGASGTLLVKNTASPAATLASYPFTIAAGSTNATVMVPFPGTLNVQFDTATAGTTCWDGDSASCQFVFNAAAFDFSVPDHVSATSQAIKMYAVSRAQSGNTCVPAFSGSKPVAFSCTYVDPASGTLPVVLQSGASQVSLACGGGAQTLNVAFDAAGMGQFNLAYADAGRVQLAATYVPASMTGSASFTVYPAKFAVGWPTPHATTIAAGDIFKVRVTALNSAGNATPNYGRESTPAKAVLASKRCLPEPGDDGVFTGALGSFANGFADADSSWDEVGTLDVSASNNSYLGLAVSITGSSNTAASPNCSGAFGRFRPHHFTTELADPARTWVYSGQPFAVKVNGFSLANTPTQNYNVIDGFQQDMTFSAWGVPPDPGTANPGPGAVTPFPITKDKLADPTDAATGAVIDGAIVGSPAYTFDQTKLPVKPTWIYVRATSDGATSQGYTEAKIEVRTGRLRMSNAFGGAARDLAIPVRVEYWTGSSWLLNQGDSYTILPASAIGLTTTLSGVAAQGTAKLTNGIGSFTLKHPTGAGASAVGTVRIAANLGTGAADQSCLSTHPASTGAALAWLHSLYGSCNASWNQDPTAVANFGVTSPENKATIHVRESFN
jgi:hypothetical protein